MPVRVVNNPLSTRDVGDSELSEFERRSIRFSRWSFYVAAVNACRYYRNCHSVLGTIQGNVLPD